MPRKNVNSGHRYTRRAVPAATDRCRFSSMRYRCPNGKSKGQNSFFNVGEENSLEL